MQSLIDDMLSYSRVTSRAKPFVPTDLNVVLQKVCANLRIAIAESKAEIIVQPLPTLIGDESQFVQLFQNLIGNAIKFRGQEPPLIQVTVRKTNRNGYFRFRITALAINRVTLSGFLSFSSACIPSTRLSGHWNWPGHL